jgi:hypothetical protein
MEQAVEHGRNAALSPSSFPQSSTGRFDVIKVLACPVPQIRNNFFRLVSQSFWPSFVKYTAAGVRYPRLMCSLS